MTIIGGERGGNAKKCHWPKKGIDVGNKEKRKKRSVICGGKKARAEQKNKSERGEAAGCGSKKKGGTSRGSTKEGVS